MKINRIASSGFLAVNNIEVDVRSPIVLFCGPNEAGKSSLRDGIHQAFTGDNPRVQLKKNYKFLVNDRDHAGYTYVDYDGNQKAAITIPNGTHELTGSLHSALPYVLNPALFASITPDERAKFLFDLGNLRSDAAEVKQKLLDRGCDAGKIDEVMPFLRSSFENAHKQATDKTKEARADWKAVTGETYGDKKAEGWKAQVPAIDASAKEKAEAELSKIDLELDAQNQKLGALQAEFNSATARNAEIVRLRTEHEKIDRIKAKLGKDRQEVAMWTVKVNDTRLIAQGSKPGAVSCACPSCGTELVFDGEKLIERGGDLHGDEDAAVKLPEYEKALGLVKTSVTNGERDLVSATAAGERIAVMEAENKSAPDEQALSALKANIEVIKASRKEAKDLLDEIESDIKLASEAEEKTKKAAGHHDNVQAWDKIASALAPDRIPSEMLHAALDPINARLSKSAAATGWKSVLINPDMSISYEERPYGLSSASAKWRANVMIAEAISHISGIKFLMADEFDLLDLPSRSACLRWLVGLVRSDEIDSVLLFGTLKEKPAKLPSEVTAHWIQGGVLIEQAVEAAA
ncbi:AAA family ATPase [Nitrosomonas sp.]|uniref:AAA family ATPase n=1 Tax=Nitrosomonas sp. TaxID=42353 RepID=UPI0025EB29E1|nr:AAA family ATPase [Nitrosomonas sp.]MBV6447074.1 hypothetical protein [Nitrosomonas sp.]